MDRKYKKKKFYYWDAAVVHIDARTHSYMYNHHAFLYYYSASKSLKQKGGIIIFIFILSASPLTTLLVSLCTLLYVFIKAHYANLLPKPM